MAQAVQLSSKRSESSISKNPPNSFYQALIKGIVTNDNRVNNCSKNCSKDNLLNRAILSTLNNRNAKDFSLKLIETLIDEGAIPCNDYNLLNDNSLLFTLNYYNRYVNMFELGNGYTLAKQNMLNLIDLLMNKCGNNMSTQIKYNILSSALKTKDSKIIERIFELYGQSQFETESYYSIKRIYAYEPEYNILNVAVITKNDDLYTSCIKYCAEVDNKTLTYAVRTGNPKIIFEIIMIGGKPLNDCWNCTNTTFFNLYYYCKQCTDFREFDQIISLLMCSGATVHERMYNYLRTFCNCDSKIIKKIMVCYYLLNSRKTPERRLKNVEKLRNRLKIKMQEMIDASKCKERNDEIKSTIISMPICCTNLIYEYQIIEPKFNIIDWSQ